MKKILVLLITSVIFFLACDLETYDDPTSPSDPWSTYESYLSHSDYTALLDSLATKTNINRSIIDAELENLNVRQNYEYSFYDSSSYSCYSMNWNDFSSYSYDWIYYVDVDIWVNNSGSLERDMCSYYTD